MSPVAQVAWKPKSTDNISRHFVRAMPVYPSARWLSGTVYYN